MSINFSYYDMISVRCENCEKELDYPTIQEAVEMWPQERRK